MIVKDESEIIERCLKSVKPFVSHYDICDTGSTDNTIEIIKKTMEGIPGSIHQTPWVDFSTNRNLALDKSDSPYILIMDADQQLVVKKDSLQLPDSYDGFYITLIQNNLKYKKIQLIKNDKKWKYTGVTHEVLSHPRGLIEHLDGIEIIEIGDSSRRKSNRKFEEDLDLLLKDKESPRNTFYIAQTYYFLNQYSKALSYYYDRVKMGGWDEEIYYSLYMIGKINNDVGDLFKAYCYRPKRYEALAELLRLLRDRKQWKIIVNLTDNYKLKSNDLLFIENDAEPRVIEERAIALYYLGRKHQAKQFFEIALHYFDLESVQRERIKASLMYCDS